MRNLFEKYIYAVLITLVVSLATFLYLKMGKITALMFLDTELAGDVFEDVQEMEDILDLSEMENMTFEDIAYSNQMSNELAQKTTDKYTQKRIDENVEDDLKKYEEELFEQYRSKHEDDDVYDVEALKQQIEQERLEKEQKKAESTKDDDKAFKGKTTSKALVENRKVLSSYNPQYMCRGGATVLVNIKIDQAGKVIGAEIDGQSLAQDDCFKQAARRGALRTRFNRDMSAEKVQSGQIIYTFIPQIR